MNDFIADDQAAEAELLEQQALKKEKRRRKREQAGEDSKKASIKALDDEDLDLVRENAGIELKKKNRLKRNAVIEAERSGADPRAVPERALPHVKDEAFPPAEGAGRRVKRDIEPDHQETQIDTHTGA